MGYTQEAPQPLLGEGIDELILARRGKDNAEHPQEFVLIGGHVLNGHHGELNGPDPAHLGHPMIGLFQRRFLAEILGVLAVAQALTFLDHPLSGGVVDGLHGLLHMVQPALLGQIINIPPLGNYPAVLVAAAPGLAHIQGHFVLRAVGRSQVKVGGEHTGGHIAKLAAHDVPGAGVQLFLHPVPGKLDHPARHVLPFVAGIAGDAAQPAGLLAQLRDVKGLIEGCVYIIFLFLRGPGHGHIHHIGNVADGLGALFPAGFKNSHDLEKVGGHGSNLTVQLPVGLLLGDELAPGGGKAFSGIQFFFQHDMPPILVCCCAFIISEMGCWGNSTKGRFFPTPAPAICIPTTHTNYRV